MSQCTVMRTVQLKTPTSSLASLLKKARHLSLVDLDQWQAVEYSQAVEYNQQLALEDSQDQAVEYSQKEALEDSQEQAMENSQQQAMENRASSRHQGRTRKSNLQQHMRTKKMDKC